ncbi:beta-lactamase family protein [Sutcliffiella horikoshii]|uniref:serine hydrolase domain-containing protein n=1 Tax=Sutcliffiella horikoshii TaxID=79883 RepID=UPI001CBAF192|nr:serine hydrolase domain-containing protein [Sutcliffiella horikoshii]UAL47345.1 beta-lactamase family protein [Sutcliffiella horikoshii]
MYENYLDSLIENKELPGAVLYVSKNKQIQCHKAVGRFIAADEQNYPVKENTLFDVASLTKVVATLPASLLLLSRGDLHLEKQVQHYLPEFRHKKVKVEDLLTHRSGLPPDLPYVARDGQRDVMDGIYRTELRQDPGISVAYSDLGMILLGKIIEKTAGQPLDTFTNEHIFTPWGLHNTGYKLPPNMKAFSSSTEKFGAHYIQGEVHDEKALHLGGVSGSAGLFSTAKDIAKFAEHFLYPEEQDVIPPALMRMATLHKQSNRGLGFEVWNVEGDPLSCGQSWPKGSFGHTGFTGTSVWIDPQNELIVAFLTNAVHYGRSTNIRTIRKTLHSMIYSSIQGENS